MGESGGGWGRAPLAAMVPVKAGGGLVVSGMGGGAAGEERWRHFDSSVNAVSFGFVATAVLIAMFLVMAIFERFLQSRRRPRRFDDPSRRSASSSPRLGPFEEKLEPCPSPKVMGVYAKEVSVLMPGEDIPTFIAHPAPSPCSPERIIHWPSHRPISLTTTCSPIPS